MRGSITPVIPRGETIWFEYNPPEFETAKDVNWVEIGVPGSDFPLQQFVRGGLRTLTTEVQANEIGTLFGIANGKAEKAANDEAHARLWLFLRISLFAIAAASLGALVLKALGT